LACTELHDPKPYEGLLVYSFPEPSAVVESWQKRLLELEADTGVPVDYASAQRHLEDLQADLRGEPLGTAARAERARVVASLLAEDQRVRPEFPLNRYRSLHRVLQAAGGR
jgi:hypothetical protein